MFMPERFDESFCDASTWALIARAFSLRNSREGIGDR